MLPSKLGRLSAFREEAMLVASQLQALLGECLGNLVYRAPWVLPFHRYWELQITMDALKSLSRSCHI